MQNLEIIMNFFKEKKTLSVDDVLIAYCRKCNIIRKRLWAIANLYRLSHKGLIRKIDRYSYTLSQPK